MKIFTEEEYWQLCEESIEENGKRLLNYDGFDEIWQCENQFSIELNWDVELRPGLALTIFNTKLHQELKHWSIHDEPYPLISKFHLSGDLRTMTPGMKEISNDYIEQVGRNYLLYLPSVGEIHHYADRESCLFIVISIDIDVFKTFAQGFESLPTPLQVLIHKNSPPRFHSPPQRH